MKLFTCGIVKRKIDFYTHAHTHSLSLSHTHARAHSLSLTHIHTPSYTHAYPHSRTLTQSFKVSSISHSQCPPHSLSLLRSLSLILTHSHVGVHTHTHTHTPNTPNTHTLSLSLAHHLSFSPIEKEFISKWLLGDLSPIRWRWKEERRINSFIKNINYFLRMRKRKRLIGGLHSSEVAFLLLTQQPQVRFSAFQKIDFDVAEIYCWCWLEEKGQWLENVDQIHLVLASGKQVLH